MLSPALSFHTRWQAADIAGFMRAFNALLRMKENVRDEAARLLPLFLKIFGDPICANAKNVRVITYQTWIGMRGLLDAAAVLEDAFGDAYTTDTVESLFSVIQRKSGSPDAVRLGSVMRLIAGETHKKFDPGTPYLHPSGRGAPAQVAGAGDIAQTASRRSSLERQRDHVVNQIPASQSGQRFKPPSASANRRKNRHPWQDNK